VKLTSIVSLDYLEKYNSLNLVKLYNLNINNNNMTKLDPRQVIINLAIQKKKALIQKKKAFILKINSHNASVREQRLALEEQEQKLIEEQNRLVAEQRKKLIEEQRLLKEKVNNDKFDLAKDLSVMIDTFF